MAHADILDTSDSLRKPLIVSAAFHVGIVAFAIVYAGWIARGHEQWGSNVAGGGAVEVGSVKTIPIPGRTGRPNPLASNTESQVPEPPPEKKAEKRQPKAAARRRTPVERQGAAAGAANRTPQPAARALARKPALQLARTGRRQPDVQHAARRGQHRRRSGFFVSRYGAYASLIIQRIAEQWQTAGLDARSQRAPAIITFVLHRDGSVATPVVMQSSGNYNIDTAARRAILAAAPFPPLPPEYNRDSANVDIQFNLK